MKDTFNAIRTWIAHHKVMSAVLGAPAALWLIGLVTWGPVWFRFPNVSTGDVWGTGLGAALVSGIAAGMVAALVAMYTVREERETATAALDAEREHRRQDIEREREQRREDLERERDDERRARRRAAIERAEDLVVRLLERMDELSSTVAPREPVDSAPFVLAINRYESQFAATSLAIGRIDEDSGRWLWMDRGFVGGMITSLRTAHNAKPFVEADALAAYMNLLNALSRLRRKLVVWLSEDRE